jgi:2-polyprenyl-3-methyl-5-hydroxy-6-metoxy-1,4-benzoquinol methylase
MTVSQLAFKSAETGTENCFVCQASTSLKYHQIQDLEYASYIPVDFVGCNSCGLIRQSPLPSANQIADFYPRNYRNFKPIKKDLMVWLKNLQADGFARRIAKNLQNKQYPKILDIGFGNGQLLLALKRLGYNSLHGSDFNERECEYLKAQGIKLAFSNVEEDFPFDEKFDCIVLNNVVEHFLNPKRVIELCQKHLNNDGCLIMVTPNAAAFELELFGRYWAGFHAPRHTFLFTPVSMALLAKSAGFTSIRTEAFCDPGQWAISIQNALQATNSFKSKLKLGLAFYTVPLAMLLAPIAMVFCRSADKSSAIMAVCTK